MSQGMAISRCMGKQPRFLDSNSQRERFNKNSFYRKLTTQKEGGQEQASSEEERNCGGKDNHASEGFPLQPTSIQCNLVHGIPSIQWKVSLLAFKFFQSC